ncbi:hypothetical protein RRG08_027586 [Elysia crispata]|uniref:Uncharacterized protein n=1 Tax=Elysia crispata TaxID=231223 RepID=A0AAE1DYV6_9GAST|nr:hypothetical protein RRG08_027586 [Elysia crispata]
MNSQVAFMKLLGAVVFSLGLIMDTCDWMIWFGLTFSTIIGMAEASNYRFYYRNSKALWPLQLRPVCGSKPVGAACSHSSEVMQKIRTCQHQMVTTDASGIKV